MALPDFQDELIQRIIIGVDTVLTKNLCNAFKLPVLTFVSFIDILTIPTAYKHINFDVYMITHTVKPNRTKSQSSIEARC